MEDQLLPSLPRSGLTFRCLANRILLYLLLLRPPRLTLFPYPTLFRSPRPAPPARASSASSRGTARVQARRSVRDRKSTRLNSSHQIISYAVFCLKKKKDIVIKQIGIRVAVKDRDFLMECVGSTESAAI